MKFHNPSIGQLKSSSFHFFIQCLLGTYKSFSTLLCPVTKNSLNTPNVCIRQEFFEENPNFGKGFSLLLRSSSLNSKHITGNCNQQLSIIHVSTRVPRHSHYCVLYIIWPSPQNMDNNVTMYPGIFLLVFFNAFIILDGLHYWEVINQQYPLTFYLQLG